jgi:hypothetical protein
VSFESGDPFLGNWCTMSTYDIKNNCYHQFGRYINNRIVINFKCINIYLQFFNQQGSRLKSNPVRPITLLDFTKTYTLYVDNTVRATICNWQPCSLTSDVVLNLRLCQNRRALKQEKQPGGVRAQN